MAARGDALVPPAGIEPATCGLEVYVDAARAIGAPRHGSWGGICCPTSWRP